jgi:hypothetical protein
VDVDVSDVAKWDGELVGRVVGVQQSDAEVVAVAVVKAVNVTVDTIDA